MRAGRSRVDRGGLAKAPTGITGFDEITGGGLPRGRLTVFVGRPGAGKTVFALQALSHGARTTGEPGLFVAFEETSRDLLANAATFGWDLKALTRAKGSAAPRLAFLDARLFSIDAEAGTFDLVGLLAIVRAKAAAIGARWVVFDGLDMLLALLDDPVKERLELARLHEWLRQSGLTGVLTIRVEDEAWRESPRYAFLQFMADCVVLFVHRVSRGLALRSLRVAKYRGSPVMSNECLFVIAPRGIELVSPGATELTYTTSRERVSSGVRHLDAMLNGGYHRGATVLITGAPGTAKTTLAGAFAAAACRRGERTLFLTFDEGAGQVVRDLASVQVRLGPSVQSGILRMYGARAGLIGPEVYLVRVLAELREFAPRCLVIDPLSALSRSGDCETTTVVTLHLLDLARRTGLTTVCTSLLESSQGDLERTPIEISTVADTWLHLSYVVRGGERNRALSIVKARGTKHSNQVRELILSDQGVSVADVYTAAGDVLMGTARWEKEQAERTEAERLADEFDRRRRELTRAAADIAARQSALTLELEARRVELQVLAAEEERRLREVVTRRANLATLRASDRAVVTVRRKGALRRTRSRPRGRRAGTGRR